MRSAGSIGTLQASCSLERTSEGTCADRVAAREPPQARLQRHRGLRDQPRLVADLLRRRCARAGRGVREGGVRGGDQLHRHRQRVWRAARRSRCSARCSPTMTAPPTCSPRRSTSRCPHRQGALGGADPQADRRLAGAPAAPTTWTSTSAIATTIRRRWRRRWGRSAKWWRGQGAPHRLQRVARGEDRSVPRAARTSPAGSPASRSTRCCGADPRPR